MSNLLQRAMSILNLTNPLLFGEHAHQSPCCSCLHLRYNNVSERQRYESEAIKVSYAGGPASGSNSISRVKERVECLPEAAELLLLYYQGCKSYRHLDKRLFSLKTRQRTSGKTSRSVVIGIWEKKKWKTDGEQNKKKKRRVRKRGGDWKRKIMSFDKESRATKHNHKYHYNVFRLSKTFIGLRPMSRCGFGCAHKYLLKCT